MKICTRCKTEKEDSLFQIRAASKDGLTAACKDCLSQYDKKRANLPHRVKARQEYAKTVNGLISSNKAKKKWQQRNQIKRAAHVITGNAIYNGRLIKQKCEECGSSRRIHAHHDDYFEPLKVRWLCPKCHCQWHAENGEGLNP